MRHTAVAAVLVTTCLAFVAGCAEETDAPGAVTASPTPTPAMALDFARTEPHVVNEGTAEVKIDVVSLNGGEVSFVNGRSGRIAISYPVFAPSGKYPRAVLRVSPASGATDALSPGDRDFVWGASFRLDDFSEGSPVDNGDNLVQRGTSGQPSLFKAELDHRLPACTLRGDAGEVIVRSTSVVQPGVWYTIRCVRDGNRLGVRVNHGGEPADDEDVEETWGEGKIGAVDFDPAISVTVGGKIGADGKILAKATDQFNGLVLNPVLVFTDGS